MPRRYDIKLDDYNMTPAEQREIKYFCLSYPDKKNKLRRLNSLSVLTNNQIKQVDKLKRETEIIEKAVRLACGEDIGMYKIMLKNLTENISLQKQLINAPCGINQLYEYRKRAFSIICQTK